MSIYRRFLILCLILGGVVLLGLPSKSQVVGKNVNMVSGTKLPGGDPFLQRQNEPSLAVSTRNPMHLLAGANDYRTVDMPHPNEYIPNFEYEGESAAPRDAWLGVFKSIDGGESWFSTLLPGFPQDTSLEGNISPIKGYTTAADPVVRAGTNGMFYYAGIAFNRGGTDPSSQQGAVFISRFIDNNDQEAGDPIQYIDTRIIHAEPGDRFIDKPWIAVDLPREGQGSLTLVARDVPVQQIARHTVYMAYTLFEGEGASMHSTIYVVHSEDCGATWSEPFPISGANTINQGAVLDINPENGKLYIAWRRFATLTQTDAILMACFGPQGQYYEPPVVIAELLPFDQPTQTTEDGYFSFRTNSYPTLAVDNLHNIHVAWSQRTHYWDNDASRVMISHSTNGKDWTVPQAVDHCGTNSHQFMPSLNYGGGRLALVWYDQRYDLNQNFEEFIQDYTSSGLITHTLDLKVAVAESGAHPFFGASQRLTKFLHVLDPEAPFDDPASIQAEYHYPTMPLFMQGRAPFLGDYIDLAFQKFILKNDKRWTYNDNVDLALFHAAWADNRDVVPPPPPDFDWETYTPPLSEQDWEFHSEEPCDPDRTGMRNQNIYTASISGGLVVGAPGNAKPLNIQRAFVVFVKNETDALKTYLLTIESSGPEASFLQFESLDSLEVEVAPYSSVARTVYVSPSSSKDTVRVNVTEVGGTLSSYVDLNADPTNPNVRNPNVRNPNVRNPNVRNYEVYNPNVRNPNVRNEGVDNPNVRNELLTDVNILNPNVRNTELQNNSIVNPNVRNDDLLNPNVRNADLTNPNVRNDHLINPNVRNEAIGDPSGDPDPVIDDYTWVVRNDGNTTAAYMYSAVTNQTVPDGIHLQLLIYKVHAAPVANRYCELKEEHHDELLVNISDPEFYDSWDPEENPNVRNPNVRNPNVRNASFYLGPGEEAWITLRVYDPDKTDNVSFDPAAVEMAATAQAVNTEDVENGQEEPSFATSMLMVIPLNLPVAHLNQDYNASVAASGGQLPYTWSVISGNFPTGLNLNPEGLITGVPDMPGTYDFEAQVTDSNLPTPGIMSGFYTIRVIHPLVVITDILPEGFKGGNYSAVLAAIGGTSPITWTLAGGSLPNGLSLSPDGTIAGKPSSIGVYNFAVQAVDSSSPAQNTVKSLQISIAEIIEDWVAFYDGGFPQSTIKKNVNAAVLDSAGNLYITGKDMHTYRGDSDIFIAKYDSSGQEAWNQLFRFDGSGFDDEGLAIVVDNSENFVYVTGYTGTSSGTKDFITIKVDASGDDPVYVWSSSYDGPGNDDDWAVDIATDASNKVFITGTSTGGTGNQMDICTICYDPLDGTALWTTPKNLIGDQFARAIILNGAELFVGGTTDQPGSPEYYILKYVSASGNEITAGWPVVYGGSGTDDLKDIVIDSTGNIIATGASDGFGSGGFNYVTQKFDGTTGAAMWTTTLGPHVFDGSGRHDEPFAMTIDSVGNVYVTGRSDATDEPDPLSDYGTVKIDGIAGGNLWTAFYRGPIPPFNEQDVATAIAVDSTTGDVYVAGYSDGYQTSYDYALVKYAQTGWPTPTGVNQAWEMRYDYFTHFNDEARTLVLDSAGNPIVSGHIINQGDDEIHTLKYDTSGNLMWERTIFGLEDVWGDPSRGLSVDAAGNIYASGPSYQDGNSYDFALTKFGPDGSEIWSIDPLDFSGNGRDWVVGNELDGQGYIYVAGTVIGDHGDPADLNTDWGVVKYNASSGGKPTPVPGWPIEYNGPGNMFDWLADFHVDEAGNVFMTGDTDVPSYTGYGKMAVVKYDASGSMSWQWQGPQNSYAHAVTSDSDGFVYAAGTAELSPGNWDIIVVKLDPSGGIVNGFPVFYDGTGRNDRGYGIALDAEGNIHVTGWSGSNTFRDYITLKFDSGGNLLWAARYDGTNHTYDEAYEIKLDDAGNVYVTGLSAGFETGYDVATIKYDSDGNELWVARYDSPFHQAENISYQDYPLYIDHQGNVYVAFISRMGDERLNDAAVVMYDKNGNLIWSKVFNSTYSNIDNAHAIRMDPDGDIIISVSSYTYETRGDRCVVKYTKKK